MHVARWLRSTGRLDAGCDWLGVCRDGRLPDVEFGELGLQMSDEEASGLLIEDRSSGLYAQLLQSRWPGMHRVAEGRAVWEVVVMGTVQGVPGLCSCVLRQWRITVVLDLP
jgi:hypothetical protein